MTKKLIYLEDALDALAEESYHNEEDYRTAVKAIGGLPSAQPIADDDLVSRESVKKWLERWDGYIDMDIVRRMQYRVIDIPSTQLERKKGRWIEDPSGYGFWICSACGFVSEASCADLLYNFCPHCGADMRGEQDE